MTATTLTAVILLLRVSITLLGSPARLNWWYEADGRPATADIYPGSAHLEGDLKRAISVAAYG